MTADKPVTDLKPEFDEGCLMGNLAPGLRKSGLFPQFVGRINRRNTPAPITMLIAPTGKASARLSQLGQASDGAEVQKPGEELEADILKPKF